LSHATATPPERPHADGFFELAYLLAQRRLRSAQSRRRAGEAELLGDATK
jgi:hypothetical protein